MSPHLCMSWHLMMNPLHSSAAPEYGDGLPMRLAGNPNGNIVLSQIWSSSGMCGFHVGQMWGGSGPTLYCCLGMEMIGLADPEELYASGTPVQITDGPYLKRQLLLSPL